VFAVRKALDAVRPAVVIVLETEIWRIFCDWRGSGGVPVIFVGGRVSSGRLRGIRNGLAWLGFFLRRFCGERWGMQLVSDQSERMRSESALWGGPRTDSRGWEFEI